MTSINYLNTIDIGKVQSWDGSKDANITPVQFPGLDADEVEGVDTLGVSQFTSVSGRLIGTFSQIQNAINDLKFILDGNQTSSSTFYSPFINTVLDGSKIRGNIGTNTSTSASKLIDSSAFFSTWQIRAGDYVKNLTTGDVTTVVTVDSQNQLTLNDNIFTASSVQYAVTAHIEIKLLGFSERWNLPGLNYCDYTLSFMQVKEE